MVQRVSGDEGDRGRGRQGSGGGGGQGGQGGQGAGGGQGGGRPEDGLFNILRGLLESNRNIAAILQRMEGRTARGSEGVMDFRPALEVGDVVEVLRSAGPKRVLIDGMGPLPHYRHDFGQLTADSLNQDVTQLDLPDGEMAQYRFSPMALYNVRFNHPGGTEQWRTSTQRFDIPPYLIDQGLPQALAAFYFAASEFWVFKDETPRFDLIQAYSRQVEAYADFWGWRYHYVELERGDEFPVTKVVRANGWPS